MISRLLSPVVFSPHWGRQMRFIAGPRQGGKTTLAKEFLRRQKDEALYYNWDERELRTKFHQGDAFLKEDLVKAGGRRRHWVCYDEIHKMPQWKNILKADFDAHEDRARFVVTGSARLDLFRRAGDSLAGRYFLFHLFPFNLFELTRKAAEALKFHSLARTFVEDRMARSHKEDQARFETLFRFGGFPEPFLKASARFLQIWHRGYMDRLIREDLRDLTRIGELENVASLVTLLPERVGSPLSINSLRGDLAVSHETVQNYLQALKLCYFVFEISVHTQKINRSLRKEKKVYFHDWSFVTGEAKRFENYVAAELLSWVSLWSDSGIGEFSLRYVRTREGKECDFLILRGSQPWLLIEAKLQPQPLPRHFRRFAESLGKIPVVQVVREKGIARLGAQNDFYLSASRFFSA